MKIKNLKLKISKNNVGFTIVELLIYMGLLSILLVVLTEIFTSILDVQLESQATSSVQQDGRYVLGRLSYDITRATSIQTPPTLGAANATPSLTLTVSGVPYTYTLVGSNLYLDDGLEWQLNNYDTQVSSLSFTRLGNPGKVEDTITVSFTLRSKVSRPGVGQETVNFQTTIAKRRN